jgi:predicted MPP superfamily phosphohydrolase
MRRVAWLTDLHLNFVPPKQVSAFFDSVEQLQVDVVLVGGDISEAPRLAFDLSEMSARVRKPIYFVLGNHDYYRSSIAAVRSIVSDLCQRMPNLVWLSENGVIELTPQTALIGHDGWGDGLLGSFDEAVMLNDDLQIEELTTFDKYTLFARLRELGQQAADHLQPALSAALQIFTNVCLLTHVPPFREACWHEGEISADGLLPRFACGAVGNVIQELMPAHPDKVLTVLCGHTHSPGTSRIMPNVNVLTAGAKYGQPQVQKLFWAP